MAQCDLLLFVHLERTGGTSVRQFMDHEMHRRPDWLCVGQLCPMRRTPSTSACADMQRHYGVGGMLEFLGDAASKAIADRGCRIFAEVHNNEWRTLSTWSALSGIAAAHRRRGCRTSLFTTLREPYEQIVSEMLYFSPPHRGPPSVAQGRELAVGLAENTLVKLSLVGKQGWREATPRLDTDTLVEWARGHCRALARALDVVLFTESLADDWSALVAKHNLSGASSVQQAGRGSNASASATLLRELRPQLAYHNRLSRLVYELLHSHRQLALAQRCEADTAEEVGARVPSVTQPPPPPPPPPSPPWACVPTNASGCRRDDDCCEFVERGEVARVFCERRARGRGLECVG